MPFKTLRLLAVLGLAVGLATMLGSAKAGAAAGADRYIVKLTDAPLASYRGGVPGLAATNPAATGKVKLDPTSAASKGYVEFLAGKQAAVVEALTTAIGRSPNVDFRYHYAYNGFAVTLTEAEATALGKLPGVAKVQKEFKRELLTDAGPAWIGAPSIWSGASTGGGCACGR